jgi:hypothetical protein
MPTNMKEPAQFEANAGSLAGCEGEPPSSLKGPADKRVTHTVR